MRPLPVTTKIGIDTSGNGVEAEMSKMSTAPVDIWHIQMFYYAYRIPNYVYILHIHHIWWYTKLRLYLRYIYIYTSIKSSKNGRSPAVSPLFGPTGGWTRQVFSGFASRHLIGGPGEYWTDGNLGCTPWKINMKPTNHPFRKENDLPNLHDYVSC